MSTLDLRGSASELRLAHNGGTVRLTQTQGKIALKLVVGKGDPGPAGPGSSNGDVATYVGVAGSTQTALDARYPKKSDLWLNVKDSGAVGNGVTDDSQAFLDAINTAAGKPVYVPKGDYVVSLALTDQDVHLIGPGRLVHQQAKSVITCKRTLGAPISVTAITSLQLGANSAVSQFVATETVSALTLSGASLSGVTPGDLYLLTSQDQYPWTAALATLTGNATTQVWLSGFVPVLGVGLTATITGTISEGDTVTGGTSGASAPVLSIAPTNTAGTSTVLLGKTSGNFSNGEALRVGGTTQATLAAAPFLVMQGALLDNYATSPVVRKVPTTGKFVIDGPQIVASGDIDSIVGAANRQPAVILRGVYKPYIKSRVVSAWTRVWQFASVYGGYVETDIVHLPDNANLSESAYGYGVEFVGATEACTAVVRGGHCRHGFTTNVFWGGFQFMDTTDLGVPKYNTVRDSEIKNAYSASFDTHWGAYFTTFKNCRSVQSSAGYRNVTESAGFQNRGFGTTYDSCSDTGSVIGFEDGAQTLDAGFSHVNRWRNCVADNFQLYGFASITNAVSNNAKYVFTDCEARGDGRSVNTPYFQAGYFMAAGVITFERCVARRFNGSPVRLSPASGTGRYNLVDFYADYFESPANTSGLRLDANPSEFNVQGYKVRPSPFAASSPAGAFRVISGAVTLNLEGYSMVGVASLPLVTVSGGSVNVVWKGQTVRPIAYVADANATLTARVSAPVQVWNTALTANRTVTLDTTAGVAINGDVFRVVRTANATGASTLTVAGKALAVSQWAEVTYDGTAWQLTGLGSL